MIGTVSVQRHHDKLKNWASRSTRKFSKNKELCSGNWVTSHSAWLKVTGYRSHLLKGAWLVAI